MYRMQQAHVAYIIEIDLLLENDGESLPIEPHSEDGGGEGELADNTGALSVLYYQVSRGEGEGNEGGGKEHFDDGGVGFVGGEDAREGVGVVDAEAFGSGDGEAGVVLVKGDEVERWGGHGDGGGTQRSARIGYVSLS